MNNEKDKVVEESEWTYKESDWIVVVDGITGEAYEYHKKTGERRPIQ